MSIIITEAAAEKIKQGLHQEEGSHEVDFAWESAEGDVPD